MKILLDKKKKYKANMPCPECRTSLLHHYIRNGVRYVVGSIGQPEEIWNADLCKCPKCGNFVLTDFGDRPQYTRVNSHTEMLTALIEDEQKADKHLFFSYQFERRAA